MPTRPETTDDSILLSVRGLKTYYAIRGSFGQRLVGREAGHVKAVTPWARAQVENLYLESLK